LIYNIRLSPSDRTALIAGVPFSFFQSFNVKIAIGRQFAIIFKQHGTERVGFHEVLAAEVCFVVYELKKLMH
jgi:hypothetical protein